MEVGAASGNCIYSLAARKGLTCAALIAFCVVVGEGARMDLAAVWALPSIWAIWFCGAVRCGAVCGAAGRCGWLQYSCYLVCNRGI